MEDLWPADIAFTQLRTPSLLLREQAEYLRDKTGGLITAEVIQIKNIRSNMFAYTFALFAPSLEYRFRLFNIEYNIDPYPLKLIPDIEIHREFETLGLINPGSLIKMNISDENVFKTILKFLFRTNKTKFVIASMLAHIEGDED